MKIKNKFLTTIAILCFTSIVTMAKDVSVFSVKIADKNSFVLQLTNLKQTQIQVTLKDKDGITLLNETLIQNSSDQRKYNLRNLPSGNYTLYVGYDSIIKIQPITKENKTLEIDAEHLKTIFRPTFRQHSDYLDLTMLCLSDLKVLVEITDDEGHIIYSKINQPRAALQKRFNLSMLEEGEYTFSVKIMDSGLIQQYKESIEWHPAKNDL